jgi:hypothetical protein
MSTMNYIALSCKKATELVEKKQVSKLSFLENIQLKLHLNMCKTCKEYEAKSVFIESVLKKLQQNKPSLELDNNVKTQILNKLEKK